MTGSSLVTATVFLVGLLPSLVVGPLAGVLVDRWDHRRTLVAVSLAQAAFLLPLLAVDGRDRLWIVYLVMAAEAALGQLNDPARNAPGPGPGRVRRRCRGQRPDRRQRQPGPPGRQPLGGVLVEVAGLGLVLGDAVSFLLGAVLIALVRPRQEVGPRRVEAPALVGEWVDGLRVTVGDRGLRWGLVVDGLAAVAQGIFMVLFVSS